MIQSKSTTVSSDGVNTQDTHQCGPNWACKYTAGLWFAVRPVSLGCLRKELKFTLTGSETNAQMWTIRILKPKPVKSVGLQSVS